MRAKRAPDLFLAYSLSWTVPSWASWIALVLAMWLGRCVTLMLMLNRRSLFCSPVAVLCI